MTALSAWVAYDQRGPSAAYIATDGRISFTGGRGCWDHGRKAFSSSAFPDVAGYVGDVLFPSLILSQFVAAIDQGSVLPRESELSSRQQLLLQTVNEGLVTYPKNVLSRFTIVHLGRAGVGMNSEFAMFVLTYAQGSLKTQVLASLDVASVLELGSDEVRQADGPLLDGSGRKGVEQRLGHWNSSPHAHTSRSVFSAHCEAISLPGQPTVGGAPQLVGLYRIGCGRTFGVVVDGQPSAFGFNHLGPSHDGGLEYRNELFERVQPSGDLLEGAQRHRPI